VTGLPTLRAHVVRGLVTIANLAEASLDGYRADESSPFTPEQFHDAYAAVAWLRRVHRWWGSTVR